MNDLKTNLLFLDSSFFFFCLKSGLTSKQILEKLKKSKEGLQTNVKVLQEIVYYFHLLEETQLGYEISTELASFIEVHPIGSEDLDQLDILLERYPRLKPRVLFHVGSMKRFNVSAVLCDPTSDFREVDEIKIAPKLRELGFLG